jgi:hypothetical protein
MVHTIKQSKPYDEQTYEERAADAMRFLHEMKALYEAKPKAEVVEFPDRLSAEQPMVRRMKAAIAALPYEHPKLAVTVALDGHDSWAAKLQGAIARSRPVLELHAQEPIAPVESNGPSPAEVSAAAMRRPMPLTSYRRR